VATRTSDKESRDDEGRGDEGRDVERRHDAGRGGDGQGDEEAIIDIKGVTKSFGSNTVLEDITFGVPKGKITAILGPSGTGKSVLLKNILGLLVPDRGEIWVEGEQIVGMREADMYRVRRKFGVLFQDGALFGSMSLFDNIAFPLREHTKMSEKEVKERVEEKSSMVGLLDHMTKMPGEISGGMKKRGGLARALVMEPDIVLFDEPDSGLDPVRVAYLDELIMDIQEGSDVTCFIITHNIPSTMRTADYMGVLFRSRLVKFASKKEMKETDDDIIRQFLSGRARGPIGMDELAEEETEFDKKLADKEEERSKENSGDDKMDDLDIMKV